MKVNYYLRRARQNFTFSDIKYTESIQPFSTVSARFLAQKHIFKLYKSNRLPFKNSIQKWQIVSSSFQQQMALVSGLFQFQAKNANWAVLGHFSAKISLPQSFFSFLKSLRFDQTKDLLSFHEIVRQVSCIGFLQVDLNF